MDLDLWDCFGSEPPPPPPPPTSYSGRITVKNSKYWNRKIWVNSEDPDQGPVFPPTSYNGIIMVKNSKYWYRKIWVNSEDPDQGPEVIKLFFMLSSAEYEILNVQKYKNNRNSAKPGMLFFLLINVQCQQLLINVKMPTIMQSSRKFSRLYRTFGLVNWQFLPDRGQVYQTEKIYIPGNNNAESEFWQSVHSFYCKTAVYSDIKIHVIHSQR